LLSFGEGVKHVKESFKWCGSRHLTAKFIGLFSPAVPPFPTGCLSRCRSRGGIWRRKVGASQVGLLQYAWMAAVIRGRQLPGPLEEEEEEETAIIRPSNRQFGCARPSVV
jgi:hypothetical protein